METQQKNSINKIEKIRIAVKEEETSTLPQNKKCFYFLKLIDLLFSAAFVIFC